VTEDDKESVERDIAAIRARRAAFELAASKRVGIGPVSEEVVPAFDFDGYLTGLWIEPTALRRYTNIELEELLTTALRDGTTRYSEAAMAIFDQYWSPNSPLYQQDLTND